MVNMPPLSFHTHIATVIGHRLQIKAGTQALGGNRRGNDTAVPVIKDTAARHISRFMPEAAHSSKEAEEVIQL